MKKYLPIIFILLLAALLRLPYLSQFPHGLNADEAAIGYNAWSMIQTGKDEHGVSWPLVFRSFDDYKPPMYFYLAIPFIKLLGLTVWAVRLPSALLGVATVFVLYLLVKELSNGKHKFLPELAALILATMPWHIHFSRGAWEVNISSFFISLGVLGFLKARKSPRYFILFVLSLVASLYTYHSARIISPLLALGLFTVFYKDVFTSKKISHYYLLIFSVVVGILLSVPVASQLLSKEGQSRFSGVSVFADSGPLSFVLEMRRTSPNPDSLITKLRYNRYTAYTQKFLENYLSHFSPSFLFIKGDIIDRSRIPGFGESLPFLAPFALIGLIVLIKHSDKGNKFILIWILVAPIAASLTFQSPHALRAQNLAIPLSVIMAFGLMEVYSLVINSSPRSKKFSSSAFAVILSIQLYGFLYSYFIRYPRELPTAWQYGFEEIAKFTSENYKQYDKIIISDRYDQPYILMAFYLHFPPTELQKQLVMTPRDKFGFSTVRKFDKFEFSPILYPQDKWSPNTLIIAADEPIDPSRVIGGVKSPAGEDIFKFVSTK